MSATAVAALIASLNAPLSVTASNVSRLQNGSTADATVTTIASPNTTPSGGRPGYTFSWARIGGDASTSVSSSTAQNPTFSALVTSGVPKVSTWRVTVTDANSNTAFADITVTLQYLQI